MSGDGAIRQHSLFQQDDGGSNPTSPLQFQCTPKDLEVFRIDMSIADEFSIKYHYLHRTASNSKIAFGIRVKGDPELRGVVIWGAPVARLDQVRYLELRRMYLADCLPRNSESRVLAICARLLKKLFAKATHLISYSDDSIGHLGTIYKAAGWKLVSVIEPDKDGGWRKHKRHKRVEFGRKRKWTYPLRYRTKGEVNKRLKQMQ